MDEEVGTGDLGGGQGGKTDQNVLIENSFFPIKKKKERKISSQCGLFNNCIFHINTQNPHMTCRLRTLLLLWGLEKAWNLQAVLYPAFPSPSESLCSSALGISFFLG